MPKINLSILNTLEQATSSLSSDAFKLIHSFVLSQTHPGGGFMDRSGKADPYYSVFGLTLAYVFDIKVDVKSNLNFLEDWQIKNKIDFVHLVSLLRCYYLLNAIQTSNSFGWFTSFMSKSTVSRKYLGAIIGRKIVGKHNKLIDLLDNYKVKTGGFNHLKENAKYASVYANFLAYGLLEDLHFRNNKFKTLAESILDLQLSNGSFVNHPDSKHGIASTTAAGVLLLNENGYSVNNSTEWLKDQIGTDGGFFAGDEVPVADVLSTATSLIALSITGTATQSIVKQAVEFVNLHWDESGGFFGSVADQIPDVEYTFYALLTLGLLK